ncbi:hypothetical protein [Nocardia anaemiae]|uniref:hypothetical protein n=1 Tax=Nocardia anaemiae TaxID=263910 RepID=UPI0007A3B066|nr:hypothetical protein [Nocardia anaemiae]
MANRPIPQPPFSPELLADLHADNVAPELSEQLWPIVRNDPDALRFLNSLDDVSAELRALGRDEHVIHAMPADIAARLEEFVEGLDAAQQPTEQVATVHRLSPATAWPESSAAVWSESADGAMDSGQSNLEAPIPLARRRTRNLRWLAAAAAVIAVLACVAVAVAVDALRGHEMAPSAQPTTNNVRLGDELDATVALTALGRNDVTGALGTPAALNRCVHANGLDRTVLGSTDTTFQGRDAVLILLTGPRPHKITALVVGIGCGADDPQQLARTDIG